MYFEAMQEVTNIILIGRESDIGVVLHKADGIVKLHLTVRDSVDDKSAHDKTLDAVDGLAMIYKLWNDGNLFPIKMLLHLQNDLIEYLQDQLLTVQSTGGKPNGNSKVRNNK